VKEGPTGGAGEAAEAARLGVVPVVGLAAALAAAAVEVSVAVAAPSAAGALHLDLARANGIGEATNAKSQRGVNANERKPRMQTARGKRKMQKLV